MRDVTPRRSPCATHFVTDPGWNPTARPTLRVPLRATAAGATQGSTPVPPSRDVRAVADLGVTVLCAVDSVKGDVSTPVAPSPLPVRPAPLEDRPLTYDGLRAQLKREANARWRQEVMADSVRAARWRAQKRQWWREHRAKRPIVVRVAP